MSSRRVTLNTAGWWPIAALILSTLAYQTTEPGSLIPLAALVAAIVGRAVQHSVPGWHAPDWAIILGVGGVIAYAAFSTINRGFSVEAFAEFMVMLGAIKCFELRSARDDGQILIVSIFMILCAALGSNEFRTGLLTLAYLFVVLIAAMRIQIDAVDGWNMDEDIPETMMGSGVNHRTRICLVRSSLFAFTGIVAVGSLVFLILPREFGEVLTRGTSPINQRVTGFRETVELGQEGLISQDSREVMSVRVWTIQQGEPIEVGGAMLRLRGRTLDQYRDGTWTRSDPTGFETDALEVIPGLGMSLDPAAMRDRGSRIMEIVVTQFSGATQNATLFSLWRPIRVDITRGQGELLRDRRDDSLRLETNSGNRSEYAIRSEIPTGAVVPFARRPQRISDVPLEIIEIAYEQLREVGIEPDPMLRDPAADLAAVSALTSWLSTTKSYTLRIEPAEPGVDPTVWFLRSAQAGHCEYFASSLAMLCRAVGIRSRVVTGYLLTEFDEAGGFYRVRRSNAHAWVEAEVGRNDWREFDATPAMTLSQQMQAVNPILRWISSIETAWLSGFVSFDSRNQQRFATRLSTLVEDLRFGPADRTDSGTRGMLTKGATVLVLIAPLTLAILWLVRKQSERPRLTLHDEAAAALVALRRYWRRTDAARPPGVTLSRHARAVGPAAAAELAEAIERLTFVPDSGSNSELERLRTARSRFEEVVDRTHNPKRSAARLVAGLKARPPRVDAP